MKLRHREDRIFDKYRARGEQIVRDGAITEEFEASGTRLLVILKEPNDTTGNWVKSNGDMRSFGASGGRAATWNNLARWSALYANAPLQFNEVDVSTRESRVPHLRRIAVVNLKKTPGGSRANLAVIEEYAIRHRELLDEQLKLYRPDLSLAAGTFEILVKLRGKEQCVNPKKGNCFRYFADDDLGLCIDFYHPQQRKFTNQRLFEFLRHQLRCHGFSK